MAYAGDVVNLTMESVYVNPSVRRGLSLVTNESGEDELVAGDYIMYDAPPQTYDAPPQTIMLDGVDYPVQMRG